MWPRLHLLRDLLSEDGVIFVSIDDNEQHHLRMLMDEIFGESNYRNEIAIRRGVKSVQTQFEKTDKLNSGWEFILFYSRNPETKFHHLEDRLKEPKPGSWNNHWRGTDRPTLRYELMGIKPENGQWRWNKERSLAALENYYELTTELGNEPTQFEIDEWWFSQSPNKLDVLRMSKHNRPEHYVPPIERRIIGSLWTDLTVNESSALLQYLPSTRVENPKSSKLVSRIINFVTKNQKNAIVLDSFAGSGTTAHAVLALNKQDAGNRQFILVECEDYADSITAERVRRVIEGIPGAKNDFLKEGLGGSFTFCTLGEPIDEENMLTGEALPSYADLAAYLIHTATGISVGRSALQGDEDWLFFTDEHTCYYLIYKPDLEFLCSQNAMLNADLATRISETKAGKHAIVFAAGQYISQRELSEMGITFCQIPYELHRAARGAAK